MRVVASRRWQAPVLIVLGLVICTAVLVLWLVHTGALDNAPARRAAAVEEITTAAFTAPRSRFELNWTPGPPGTTYELLVLDEGGGTLVMAAGLERPEYRVDEAALARVPAGGRVLWRVTLVKPLGKAVHSRTFATRILD